MTLEWMMLPAARATPAGVFGGDARGKALSAGSCAPYHMSARKFTTNSA